VTTSFSPSHESPPGGVPAWGNPDPSQPTVATIDAGVPFTVVERLDDWARVVCSNGWSGWVDARRIVAVGAPAPPPACPPTTYGSAATLSAPRARPRWLLPGVVVAGLAVTGVLASRGGDGKFSAEPGPGISATSRSGSGNRSGEALSADCDITNAELRALEDKWQTMVQTRSLASGQAFRDALTPLADKVGRAVRALPPDAERMFATEYEQLPPVVEEVRQATASQAALDPALDQARAGRRDVFAGSRALVESMAAVLCGASAHAGP
jgi:SH3 domain-containing protein